MANILVAMSGGVDSTTVAYELKNAGHNVVGCYMRLHGNEVLHEENIQKVKNAANFLGIPFHVLNLNEKFNELIYKPFIQAYKDGITPNPCVLCNRFIKFGELVTFAKSLGMDKLATGHYVQIKDNLLYEAKDKSKDQSYFLSQVSAETISFMLFPLGKKLKKDIKEFALNNDDLRTYSIQKESHEICFVENTYIDILKEHMNVERSGKVFNTKGEDIGIHKGYMHYTIGKRKGFTVKGAHDPHYVISINPKDNTIVVGSKEELEQDKFIVHSLNMFTKNRNFEASVKIRYRSPKLKCKVSINDDGTALVVMNEKASAIAAGQFAVFYDGEFVLGSGIIN